MNGVRELFSIFLCLEKTGMLFPVINSDVKRKCTTAESCAKNMVRNLLSLKISICTHACYEDDFVLGISEGIKGE